MYEMKYDCFLDGLKTAVLYQYRISNKKYGLRTSVLYVPVPALWLDFLLEKGLSLIHI